MLSLLYFVDFRSKSYNVLAVKPTYDHCAPELWQTTARYFEASFYVGRTNWTP